jgi:hypothetical protein
LLFVFIDPPNIRLQHFLMLQWVLLCDYWSCFFIFVEDSERCWAINAHKIHDTFYRCHCLLFRVLFLIRIFLCLYQNCPQGHCNCLHQNTVSVTIQHPFLSYMTRAWGMPASFVHNLFSTPCERLGSTSSLLPPMGHS